MTVCNVAGNRPSLFELERAIEVLSRQVHERDMLIMGLRRELVSLRKENERLMRASGQEGRAL